MGLNRTEFVQNEEKHLPRAPSTDRRIVIHQEALPGHHVPQRAARLVAPALDVLHDQPPLPCRPELGRTEDPKIAEPLNESHGRVRTPVDLGLGAGGISAHHPLIGGLETHKPTVIVLALHFGA